MDGGQPPRDARGLPELIQQLTTDLATLVRKESELVRAELTEKLRLAAKAAGGVAAGGVLVLAALLVLLQALVLALAPMIGMLWASVIVGAVVAALGFILIFGGMKLMKPENLTPDRSARQLQKDAELMKGR